MALPRMGVGDMARLLSMHLPPTNRATIPMRSECRGAAWSAWPSRPPDAVRRRTGSVEGANNPPWLWFRVARYLGSCRLHGATRGSERPDSRLEWTVFRCAYRADRRLLAALNLELAVRS
jgi:hypothetical protein